MIELKKIFKESIQAHNEAIAKIKKDYGDKILGEVTINHLFKGMRGVPTSYTPVSHVDPELGVVYRGKQLFEINTILPKIQESKVVSAEAMFWFLLTGKSPTENQLKSFVKDLHIYANVPHYVFNIIDALPRNSRPMTRLSTALVSLATTSSFQNLYDRGAVKKIDFWEYAFDDALSLVSNLAQIVAYIYRVHCKNEDPIEPLYEIDTVGNLAHMMGFDNEGVADLLRLFVLTHADHSASNVSAHTAHTVGSALGNVYYIAGASMLGLAGPLHGRANEQSITWLLEMVKKAHEKGLEEPDSNFIKCYINDALDTGKVIPGYGHAALRVEDPRFTMFYRHCEERGYNTPLLRAVQNMYKILPNILKERGKVSNPNPNIDAISGACLSSHGIVEHKFYTVLFGYSRLFGLIAQHIINRSIGQPIFRPKTISAHMLDQMIQEFKKDEE